MGPCTCNIETSQLVCPAVLQNVIIGKNGQPLVYGTIYFYRQSDQSTLKNVYYQTGIGNAITYLPVDNPMTLSSSGSTTDPNGNDVLLFYYPFLDQDAPLCLCDNTIVDTYYVEVYDQYGTLQFTRMNFPYDNNEAPSQPTISAYDNLIANNRFWHNLGQQSNTGVVSNTNTLLNQWTHDQYSTTQSPYYITLAPSNHDGFSMPNFNYIRSNNTNVTDTITFKTFPKSNSLVLSGDIQPEFYINFQCSADTSGGTLKVFQFPISLHLATLANEPFSFTLQAQSISGNTSLVVYLYQFCGTGVASPAPVQIASWTLTPSWTKFSVDNLSFPGTEGLALGSDGNGGNDDAYYLQIAMPTGMTSGICNLNFCLPSIYLSNGAEFIPTNSFQTYDEVDSIIAQPRTGDVKISLSNFYPYGWVPMSGGTIVNPPVSPATITTPSVGISYQGTDAWRLYDLLWYHFQPYDTGSQFNPLAQMYTSAGIATDYGTNSWSDWNANKQLAVSNAIGQILLGTVPLSALPPVCNSTFTVTPTATTGGTSSSVGSLAAAYTPVQITSTQSVAFGMGIRFTAGTITNTNIALNTTYYCTPLNNTVFYISSSLANAQNGVYILNGTGAASGLTLTINSTAPNSLILTMTNAPVLLTCYVGQPIIFSNTGGALPTGLTANTVYYAVPTGFQSQGSATIGVATSFANAIKGNLIAYSNTGSGTNTVTLSAAGMKTGEYQHDMLIAELVSHAHLPSYGPSYSPGFLIGVSSTGTAGQSGTGTVIANGGTASTGGGLPFNITQPGINMNMFIKL